MHNESVNQKVKTNSSMKKIFLVIMSFLIATAVNAQFSGSFAPSQWTTSAFGSSLTASIDTSMTPDSLFINGPNDETGLPGSLSYSVIIPANGSLTFSYVVTSRDTAAVADPYEYIAWKVNSDTLSFVTDSTTGITTFLLVAGDTFTFAVSSSLNESGIIQAKIYNWSFIQDPLAIEGGGLSGMIADGNINLQWDTYSETTNKGFEIQRSEDGKAFTTISFVNSKAEQGSSTAVLSYDYTESIPSSETGILLYRYRQVDFDYKSTYSNIVEIHIGLRADSKLTVYPNPSGISNYVTLDNKEPGTIYVFDFTGRQVACSKTNGPLTKINVENMEPGIYSVNFIAINGTSHLTRFTVE
jgi:hypothetical protein